MEPLPEECRSPIVGPHATCEEVQFSPQSKRGAATVANWLITSDQYHTAWTQWTLYCVHLREMTGIPKPAPHFLDATHEVGIVALNPDTHVTVEAMGRPDWRMRYLTPANLVHQFIATDDEMRYVLALMAWSVSAGYNSPEPPGSGGDDSDWGQDWLTSITKTLAHSRGEVHAS